MSFPMEVTRVRKNGHIILDNRPCKVTDIERNRDTGEIEMVGLDVFTGQRHMAPFSVNDEVAIPNVSRNEWALVNIDDGLLNLMSADGTAKDDVPVPDGLLGEQICADFEEGEKQIYVTILRTMDEEAAISYKTA